MAKSYTKALGLYLDLTTLATLQPDGEITCPVCGGWTTVETLLEERGHCNLCYAD